MNIKIIISILSVLISNSLIAQSHWNNPIQKEDPLGIPLVETSPFVFEDRLYLLENHQRFWDFPGEKIGTLFHEDEVRIRDIQTDKIVSVALRNHGFGTVLTWDERVYVFAAKYGENKWRHITEITMTSSADLKNWTKPVTVLRAAPDEFFFNTAVCRAKDKFVLLYETNDKRWPAFTFRYMESSDLQTWEEIPGAVYGKDKYVGGPALYFEGGYYYTLYLESLGNGYYETRITRSQDLFNWEDAPEDRPFITFDTTHKNIPLHEPDVSECNASDVELCYFRGRTILYFTGGDQHRCGDLQRATYEGTPQQLFEHFFKDTKNPSTLSDEIRPNTIAFDGKYLSIDQHPFLSQHDIVFLSPAVEGYEGFPLGNGDMGAMAWTPPNKLFFQINKTNTWESGVVIPIPVSHRMEQEWLLIALWVTEVVSWSL